MATRLLADPPLSFSEERTYLLSYEKDLENLTGFSVTAATAKVVNPSGAEFTVSGGDIDVISPRVNVQVGPIPTLFPLEPGLKGNYRIHILATVTNGSVTDLSEIILSTNVQN